MNKIEKLSYEFFTLGRMTPLEYRNALAKLIPELDIHETIWVAEMLSRNTRR